MRSELIFLRIIKSVFFLLIKPGGVALHVRNHLNSKLSPRLLNTNVDSVFNKNSSWKFPLSSWKFI